MTKFAVFAVTALTVATIFYSLSVEQEQSKPIIEVDQEVTHPWEAA